MSTSVLSNPHSNANCLKRGDSSTVVRRGEFVVSDVEEGGDVEGLEEEREERGW